MGPDERFNVNNKAYTYENNSWIPLNPTVILDKLQLVERFEYLRDKAFNYLLKPSQLYDNKGPEQMNVLNELMARVQETHRHSLSAIQCIAFSSLKYNQIQ